MSLDRAQRRAQLREQRKHVGKSAEKESVKLTVFDGTVPLWLALVIALPVVTVPLFFVYMLPGSLIEGSYGQIIINEFQKYVAELVSLGLLVTSAGMLLVRRNLWPWIPNQILWPAFLYLGAVALSLLQANDLERALINVLQVGLLPILFFLLLAGLRWTQSRALLLLGAMLVAGALVSLVGICQKLEVWGFVLTFPHGGAGSLLFFQNLAGEYLIILIPPALALVLMRIHWGYRLCAALLGSLFLVHLVMTLARGAWVGLLGGIAFSLACAVWEIRRTKKCRTGDDVPYSSTDCMSKRSLKLAAVLLVAVLLAGGVWIGSGGKGAESPYVKELLSINLSNTTGRVQIWTDSLGLLREHWLAGVGPGHYRVALPPHLEKSPDVPYLFQWNEKTGRIMFPFRPHNDYLQNWIELGLFGLLGMLWLFIAIIQISCRGIGDSVASGDRWRALLILGCFGSFSAWAVSMLFEFPFRMPASMLPGWLCAGLAVSLSLPAEEVTWARIRPFCNWLAGGIVATLVVACFYVAHVQFWADIYEKQAMAAWNSQNLVQGYEWQQRAYELAPWKESIGATKARMELGLKKYQEALDTSREVVKRNPYLLPVLWSQGTAARMLGHGEESWAAFRKIVEVYPFLPEVEKYKRYARM